MTEDEARSKDCCSDRGRICCASNCMAWRWTYDKVLMTTDVPGAPALEWFESAQSKTDGYCGLAGRL